MNLSSINASLKNVTDDGVFDDPKFMRTAVEEHARFLYDPTDPLHAELMWVAEEALTAPLPEDWKQGVTDDGIPYYFNVETKRVYGTILDGHYQKIFIVELKKLREEKQRRRRKNE